MKGTLPYIYFRGNVVPAEQAMISVASHSLQYGMTCFGGIRGYWREGQAQLFRLRDHHERLMNASRILGMNYYISYTDFEGVLQQLIQANRPSSDIYIRPFIYSSTVRLAPRMPGLDFDLSVYMVAMGEYFDQNKGLNLGISSWRKFSDSSLPTKAKAGGCYINSSLASTDAVRVGYDDALMLDQDGYVVEGSVSNVLMVYRDKIYVPPIGAAALEGITMRTMVELLEEEGHEIIFQPIDRSMVYTCQELMMLGTAVQIAFVATVDGRHIGPVASQEPGPGPVCRFLREKFAEILDGRHRKSREWLTAFSPGKNVLNTNKE